MTTYLPSIQTVSIVIPTLNAAAALEACLASVRNQNSHHAVEIIVADGGSSDETVSVAKAYGAVICPNPLKTGEAGKAAGVRAATGDIIAFVDSDNILPDTGWLDRMLAPFDNPDIVATEPLYYTHRRQDTYLTRYCALLGMNDPLCLYLGIYDRLSDFTGNWTGLEIPTAESEDSLLLTLADSPLPTIGANGFFIRKSALNRLPRSDYLFDVDVLRALIKTAGPVKIAKVKTGIVHIYGTGHQGFVRKQTRRIRDFLYYRNQRQITGRMSGSDRLRIAWFVLFAVLFVPNLIWAGFAFLKRKDSAIFYHPVACLTTLIVYTACSLRQLVKRPAAYDRRRWTQVGSR